MSDIQEIQKMLLTLPELSEYGIFLFGSRAKGNFRKNSDYDVGILGKQKLPLREYLEIKRDLDELPYSIDLVDFARTTPEFQNLALKNIQIWKLPKSSTK